MSTSGRISRNMLVGQLEFVQQDELLEALSHLGFDSETPIADVLVERAILMPDDQQLLDAMVDHYLVRYRGDATRSLQALES